MAYSIMIQGTMSNAGKSFIAAALCRAFVNDGYSVSPFKSQNMALNSFVTHDGFEIGRSQAMQAEAANTKPLKYMNPILLKPTTDFGSQVIVNGKPIGNMPAAQYFEYKKRLVPDILNAYNELSKVYDIIVIEGAGSPAEINLKDNDIVNMGLAKMLNCPVILAGDIDRGGVFAQIYGTVMLLDEEERKYIKGLIINKFRGDKNILIPGLKMLEDKCSIPVLGALPYTDVDIDDEDSLSERLISNEKSGEIDIAVIKLNKISNFTDLNSIDRLGISVRYVTKESQIGKPDMLVIPGSKNTIKDMLWLRQSGIERRIKELAKNGTFIFGICGGYQMLGKTITDSIGVEGGESIEAMALIDVDTYFESEKELSQTKGNIGNIDGVYNFISGAFIDGYEIHLGKSIITNNTTKPINIEKNGVFKTIGAYKKNVFGTYIHGFFDSDDMANRIAKWLFKQKGIDYINDTMPFKYYKQAQYDKMAKILTENIDMKYIYKIMGLNG